MATNKIEIIIKAINEASPTINKIKKEVEKSLTGWQKLGAAITSVGKAIVWLGKAPFRIIGFLGKAINRLVKSLISLPALLLGATAGYGMIRLVKSFFDAASAAEQFQLRLQVLLRSVSEGNRLFEKMSTFATTVPKTFREIMEAASQLARVMKGGTDEIAKWMPLVVDLSAATGLTLQRTTDQIVRMYAAGANAAILFRRRGITAMLGFQYGVSYSAEQTRKQLMEVWQDPTSQFKDAAKLLANTWEGLLSMFRDQWFLFRNDVMKSGVFDYIKAIMKSVLGDVYELRDKGRLKEWAQGISDVVTDMIKFIIIGLGHIADSVTWIVNIVGEAISLWATYKLWFSQAAQNVKDFFKGLKVAREEIKLMVAQTKKGVGLISEDEIRNTKVGLLLTKLRLKAKRDEEQAELDLIAQTFIEAEILREQLKTRRDFSHESTVYANDTLPKIIAGQRKVSAEAQRAAELRQKQLKWLAEVGGAETETEAPITEGAIATGELTAFKIYASAREALLKHWLDNEILYIDEYGKERLKLLDELYEKEAAALRGQIADLSPTQIQLRQKLLAQQRELMFSELKDEISIREDIRKQEERQIKEDYDKGRITLEESLKKRKDLVEKYGKEEANLIENLTHASFTAQTRALSEYALKLEGIERKVAKDRADIHEAARNKELEELSTTLEKELAKIEARYEKEKERAGKHLYEIIQNEEDFRQILNAVRERIEKQHQQNMLDIDRDGIEGQEKLEREALRRRQRYLRARYEVETLVGSVEQRIATVKEQIEREFEARKAAINEYYDNELDTIENREKRKYDILQNAAAMRIELAKAEAIEWEATVKRTLDPFQSAFQGFGQGFEDLGTILQWFYEVAGQQSKDFARTIKAVAIAAGIAQSLQAGISALLAGMEFGKMIGNPAVGMAIGSAFMSLAIAAGMAKVALMQAVNVAHGGLIGQFEKTRKKFPRGGFVPGRSPSPTADNIPAQLTAGEFVQPVSAVRHYGSDVMEAIRRRAIPRSALAAYAGMRPHVARAMFASGGSVAAAKSAAMRDTEDRVEFTNVNIIDPNLYDQYIVSPRGNKTFINMLTKNEDLIRRMARR